jgi:hypothetical protein
MIAPITHWLPALFLSFFIITVAHAQDAKPTDKTAPEYTAPHIGWKVTLPTLPAGWRQMSGQETAAEAQKARALVEKNAGGPVDAKGWRHLLNLEKDAFNAFISNVEPYDEKVAGPYAERHKAMQEQLLNTYKNVGAKLGKFQVAKENIDGLEFLTIELDLMHPRKPNEIAMSQKIYSRHINGFDFGITLSTNNPADRKVLEAVVAASKFSIRK